MNLQGCRSLGGWRGQSPLPPNFDRSCRLCPPHYYFIPDPLLIFRPSYGPEPMIDLDFDGCDDDDDVGVVLPTKLYIPKPKTKDKYSKYYKHWLSTVAHKIDCVGSKIINHGLNHGLLFSLFKFFGWKNILNQLENSGLKSRFLFCLLFQFYLIYRLICQKPAHYCLPKWLWWAPFFKYL